MDFLIFFTIFAQKMAQLPKEFIQETRLMMGDERFNSYMEAFNEEAPTSIRLNPKYSFGVKSQHAVPWCKEGFYLEGRPQFTFDPLFHAGCYYVQEAASMFVCHVLNTFLSPLSALHSPLKVLDLCAAPGGKSTAARSVLPEGSLLVSNEPIASRAQVLLENITKWGWPDCIVTNNYPRDFRRSKMMFDVIICDVPCSGEGMFRKDPATISEWSLQNVEKCWRLQREIVADAWECLKPYDGSWRLTMLKCWRFPRSQNGASQVLCSQTSMPPSIASSQALRRAKDCLFAPCAKVESGEWRVEREMNYGRYKT